MLRLICLFEMSGTNPNDGVGLSQFQMQALMQHMERLMKQRDDALHERLDQMENRDHMNCSRASIVQFRASRYIMRLNRTSELKVMSI